MNRNIIAVIRAVRAVVKVATIMEFAKRIPPIMPKITPLTIPAIVFVALAQHEHSFCLHDMISSSTPLILVFC